MTPYAHQCRYCAHCVFTINDTFWCDKLSKDIGGPKRPNKCDSFLFNAIPADMPYKNRGYRPRKRSEVVQQKLFDMPTDKQRRKD